MLEKMCLVKWPMVCMKKKMKMVVSLNIRLSFLVELRLICANGISNIQLKEEHFWIRLSMENIVRKRVMVIKH